MEEARQFPYRLKSVRVSLPKRMKQYIPKPYDGTLTDLKEQIEEWRKSELEAKKADEEPTLENALKTPKREKWNGH